MTTFFLNEANFVDNTLRDRRGTSARPVQVGVGKVLYTAFIDKSYDLTLNRLRGQQEARETIAARRLEAGVIVATESAEIAGM